MIETKAKQRLGGLICGACVLASPSLAQAQEGTRASIGVSSGAEVSSNPFLREDGSEAAAFYIAIDPSVYLEDGRHETVLRGSFRLSQYTNGYGLDESASVRIESDRALSERTSLGLRASLVSSRSNLRNLLTDSASTSLAGGTGTFPEPVELDPTILGTGRRTTKIETSASLEHQLSEIDAFQLKASLQNVDTGEDVGIGYTDTSFFLGYTRRISPRSSIGVNAQLSLINYEEGSIGGANAFGDANTYLLSTTIEHDLNNQWEAKAGIGVNLIDRKLGPAGSGSDVALAAEAALCRSGLQTRFCITAARSAQPTAQAGITNVKSIGLSYTYRLSKDDTFSVSSYFGRTEEDRTDPLVNGAGPRNVMGGTARFGRDLSDRATLLIQSSYSDIESSQQNVAADFAVSVGISLRLGSKY